MGVAPDPSGTVKRKRPLQSGYAFPTINTSAPASSAPSAPASDPYGLAAMLGKPIDLSGARSAARADATADTNSIVSGYRGIQAQIGRDASAQAAETNRAALAGATFEKNLGLGTALETSLKSAAGDQAGLAAGYAGDFRSTIEAANANVGKALGALGAAPLPSTADQASNVVYGVGGAIPANAMLAAAPYVKAELDRMPAATAAYGRQQAIGALGAGRERAAQFDPRIAEAEAGRSKLERDYLADYTKTATDARQDAVGNAFKAISVDQKDAAARATAAYHQDLLNERAAGRRQTARDKAADRAATKAYRDSYLIHLANGDAEQAAHDKALEAATVVRNGVAQQNANTSAFNANTSRINAGTSRARANTAATQSGKRIAISAANAETSRGRALGYLVDDNGNVHVLPGFKQNPDGTIVKVATTKPGTVNGITATSYAKMKNNAAKAADVFYWGKEPDATKVASLLKSEKIDPSLWDTATVDDPSITYRQAAQAEIGGVPGIDYGPAVVKLMHDYSMTRADAIQMANDLYAPGERGRPMTQGQKTANAAGVAKVKNTISFTPDERDGPPAPRRKPASPRKPAGTSPRKPAVPAPSYVNPFGGASGSRAFTYGGG